MRNKIKRMNEVRWWVVFYIKLKFWYLFFRINTLRKTKDFRQIKCIIGTGLSEDNSDRNITECLKSNPSIFISSVAHILFVFILFCLIFVFIC